MHEISTQKKEREDDSDFHLARKIMQNKQYGVASRADDEYDYDDGPRRKVRKKGGSNDHKSNEISKHANRLLTQQERCHFCFENPARPKHLVIAIANFTYLSLPHREPVVPGHCCILTMQAGVSFSACVTSLLWLLLCFCFWLLTVFFYLNSMNLAPELLMIMCGMKFGTSRNAWLWCLQSRRRILCSSKPWLV